MTSFLINRRGLEATGAGRVLPCSFLEGQNTSENGSNCHQHGETSHQQEFLVTKGEMLVALATVSVSISRPESDNHTLTVIHFSNKSQIFPYNCYIRY